MNGCARYEEDLALLAGGDLGPAEGAEARGHVASCGACRQLFEALQGDQAVYARAADVGRNVGLSAFGPAGVVEDVLEELARTQAAPARREVVERRPWAARRVLAAAAMVFAVAAAAALSLSTLRNSGSGAPPGIAAQADSVRPAAQPPTSEPVIERVASIDVPTVDSELAATGPALVRAPVSKGSVADRPMFVRRNRSGDVELSWAGDDRELGASQQPYTVLASAQPDFMRSEAVQVHGRHHVASGALPAYKAPDRALTFFRVE